MTSHTPQESATPQSYVSGFALSLIATFIAFGLVFDHALAPDILLPTIVTLAFVQLVIQLVLFLHLFRRGSVSHTLALVFALVVVGIVVVGSLWIMANLNGRMMPPDSTMLQYMSDQSG